MALFYILKMSFVPHEHGIEGGDFVGSHFRDVEHLGDLVHGGNGQPAVLPLGQVQEWNQGSPFMALGII